MGIKGVVVKLTEGTTYKKTLAPSQVNIAKKAGLTVSTYHFS
ncbi:GH25 family lysozyme [Enterococcus haemoperoxidus]|nr:GH25 family lysozyme [Enterococcus haemoperoxidus]